MRGQEAESKVESDAEAEAEGTRGDATTSWCEHRGGARMDV
jgi:hypothetical protein